MALLEYFKAKKILDKHKIKSVQSAYVSSAKDAAKFAGSDKIVLKIISQKALHKSKAGLVMLGLRGEKEVSEAYTSLEKKGAQLKPYKIIAQKMAKPGVEIIIGGRTDPQFGRLILLGLGGIYVEVFKDFALRTCPITKYDAQQMILQLKSRDVVTFHGKNTNMIVDLLLNVSKMLEQNEKISELDLNPILIREDGYEAVDIRIIE